MPLGTFFGSCFVIVHPGEAFPSESLRTLHLSFPRHSYVTALNNSALFTSQDATFVMAAFFAGIPSVKSSAEQTIPLSTLEPWSLRPADKAKGT